MALQLARYFTGLCLSISFLKIVPVHGVAVNASTQAPIVDLGYARYQGIFDATTGNINYLGVRYAASPAAARWKAPLPPKYVPGVQSANAQPPMCLQAPGGTAEASPYKVVKRALPPSEDCLFLNVYTPKTVKKTPVCVPGKLPVVVWIHGGGYAFGSTDALGLPDTVGGYNGNDLITTADGCAVVVVMQYRLGVFGFLAGSKVLQGGDLNAGLLDQRFALKWVQSHISKFGGDPAQVTLWGESAGGGSILLHAIADGGRTFPPLFRGAMSSSTYLPPVYKYNDRISEAVYTDVVNRTNCAHAHDTLACLRGADVSALQDANQAISAANFFGNNIFTPVVGGSFVKQRPSLSLAQGKVNGEGLLAMTMSVEGGSFVPPDTSDLSAYIGNLFPEMSVVTISKAIAAYQGLGTPFDQAVKVIGEAIIICPTFSFLAAYPGHSYKGEDAILPAHHADDLFYYFPSIQAGADVIVKYNNSDFAKAFTQGFLTFARSSRLDPNDKFDTNITPNWPLWSPKSDVEMLFNRTEDMQPVIKSTVVDPALMKRCGFWNSVTNETNQ